MAALETALHNEGFAIEDLPTRQRLKRGLAALKQLRDDPNDTELALRAALLLNAGALRRTLAVFEGSDEGRTLLAERPALDGEHVDLKALLALPENTLGHCYSAFLTSRGLTPEVFVPPREVRDPRLRYIGQRLRQTHDLWHVVTGYDTDIPGEIELQAFTYAQARTPFALFVALGGLVKAPGGRWSLMKRVWRAYRRGRNAKTLSVRVWERRFAAPLSVVRAELDLS